MADEERGGVRRWVARIGLVLAVLPLLYALSIGPVAAWAERRNNIGGLSSDQIDSLEAFYRPLFTLAEQCPPFGSSLDWYLRL